MIISALWEQPRFIARATSGCLLAGGLLASSVLFAQSEAQTEIQDLPITVQAGDTFSGIISRELHSLDAWGEVARYNKLESPDLLQPGDVVVIPAEVLRYRNYAKAVFVKGSVTHHRADGARADLEKGDKIYAGDLIETDEDGFVSVSFNGGSSVNIQPESTMKINVLECVDREDACEILLRSEKGKLGLDVKNVGFAKPTVFSIDSPYASAAVRGTRFDFDVDEGNILGVTEGNVEISLNGIRNEVKIGKGVLAGQGRSINDLFDLLAKPPLRLREDLNRISAEDVINWDSVPGADKYLIDYAANEAMTDVAVSLSENTVYTKPALDVGSYFIGNRAVASNGLRGFSATQSIEVVNIDNDAPVPVLEILVSGTEMQVIASGTSSDELEVKIGNNLATIGTAEYILASEVRHVRGGETFTVEIDPANQWYVQTRKVINSNTVSPYGLLYFFDKAGN